MLPGRHLTKLFSRQFLKGSLLAAAVLSATSGLLAQPDTTPSLVTTYSNPGDAPIADPFVYQEAGIYYMYGTTDDAIGGGFDVYTSKDMVVWTRAAKCYTPKKASWGDQNFWAAEVLKKNDKYYLHYTAYSRDETRRNIMIAVADSPLGPFEDYAGPLFNDTFDSVIDSHIYLDKASGDYYIYCTPERVSPSRIIGCKLSPDFKTLLTKPVTCLNAEYGWEDLWIEGPIIHEHEDTLYMLFSGGAYWEAEYSLGYATAKLPLGPWTKSPANPVLDNTDEVDGPGHNGLARSPDGKDLFVYYHTHVGQWTARRTVAMDRIIFADDPAGGPDALTIPGAPSVKPQPLPSGSQPRIVGQSDEFDGQLDMRRWRVFANYPDKWTKTTGTLEIRMQDGDYWRTHDSGMNVFLQATPNGDFDISTSVTLDAKDTNEQAFITIWEDIDNYVTLASAQLDTLNFAVTREVMGKADTSLSKNDIGSPVCLKIEKRGDNLRFFASADGEKWSEVCRPSTLKNIQPRYIGLGAWSPGTKTGRTATFDWFRVEKK